MRVTTKITWDMNTGEVLEHESFEYSGPLCLAGGGPAPEQRAAAASDAALSKQAADTSAAQNARAEEQYQLVKPFYTDRMKNGLPYFNQLQDFQSGLLSRAYAPAYQAVNQRFAADGLPSGSKDAALRGVDADRARAFDSQLLNGIQVNDAARTDAAGSLVGQQSMALNNALANQNSALGANNSILQSQSLASPGLSGLIGGIAGGAISKAKFIPF